MQINKQQEVSGSSSIATPKSSKDLEYGNCIIIQSSSNFSVFDFKASRVMPRITGIWYNGQGLKRVLEEDLKFISF